MFLSSPLSNASFRTIRTFVYAQIAIQVGIALTPFWSNTVAAAQKNTNLGTTASMLSSLGQATQDNTLNGLVAQQASGVATQQLQQWLNGFGTARVELGTDDHFKPQTGVFDLLLPLYKSDNRLLFTQNGMRNKDGQFTGNFGVGQRHFTGDWMLGYNAFYDQNFSHGHKRVGVGAEAWRDYMKLSANGYYRLSNWVNSGDVEDYDARPANGFDLRAESWLPAYPAIGGRLMFEQYYGDEVALFGKDQRQKNANAITAGLSWTPVPLVSFNADHKKGGSQSELVFGLQFSYQIGQPLAAQLDPASVGIKRTLAGSGMDLVDRNNNIVLEYRKRQVIELTLPKEISGPSSSTQLISYKLNSKYGLDKIIWNDATVAAAGGKVEAIAGGGYQLVLPPFVAGTANTYTLSGVAYDLRGNASTTASMQVIVTPPAVSAKNSTIVAAKDIITADGKDSSLITLTLKDEQDQPVSGLPVAFSSSLTGSQLSTVTDNNNGTYSANLTGIKSGTAAITVTVNGNAFAVTGVNVTLKGNASNLDATKSSLTVSKDSIVANDTESSLITLMLKDVNDNPVPLQSVVFNKLLAGSKIGTITDNKNGSYSAVLTGKKAGEEKISVSINGTAFAINPASVILIADATTAQIAASNLTVSKSSILANNTETSRVTAKVTDANDNPISGLIVTWSTDKGTFNETSVTTDTSGKASVDLKASLTGQSTPDGIAIVTAKPGTGTAAHAPNIALVVPPEDYVGTRFTFTGNDGVKTNSLLITGRTGTVKDIVKLTVTTSKADATKIRYTLIAPDSTRYVVKNNGDVFQSVTEVNVAGKNKAGTWKLEMDDLQSGSTSYTMDWTLTL